MSAPSLVSYTETAWTTAGTSKASASIAWQANDVIVVIAGCEATVILGTPTASGLAFTKQQDLTGAGICAAFVASAVAASSGSDAVTVTNANSADHWGFGVWVFHNSLGVGNSASQKTSTKTVNLTPTAAHGAIVWGAFDFASGSNALTPTPSNTRQAAVDGTQYSLYVGDLTDQPSAGATAYGVTAAGTGPFSIVVLEIKVGPTPGGGLLLMGVGT